MTIWTHTGIPAAIAPRARQERPRNTSVLRFTDRHHAWALFLTVVCLLTLGALAGYLLGEFLVVVIRTVLGHLNTSTGSTTQILTLPGSLGGPP